MSGDPSQSAYDVVIIGSGMGGLASAALLAKAGKSVLVLEHHDRPGGYAHGFKRKKYVFDAAVHLTSGCGLQGYQGGQVIAKILQAVGVSERLNFIPVNHFSGAVFPQFSTSLPANREAFVQTLSQHFPDEELGLKKLLAVCQQITEELAKADEVLASADAELAREKLSVYFQYRRYTLAEVCEQFLTDPKLKAVFATNWPYLGLPPSKVSFVYWATMLIGYLVDGAYYCQGGFQNLANALVDGIRENRGEVVFKRAVERINIIDGKVRGVVLASGQSLTAEIVISNADMLHTVQQMVGAEHFPKRFLQRLRKMVPSMSIFAVYLVTDLDLSGFSLSHESFFYPDYDHDHTYAMQKQGQVSFISISLPSLIDSSLAPEGESIVLLTTLLPYTAEAPWKELKPKVLQQMLDLAEIQLPGLNDHLQFVNAGSPTTMERYTLNHQGAAYGWDMTPGQAGSNRIANQAPLEGLYFAGHWSRPGGGVYGASVSGMQVAQQVLDIPQQDLFWAYLGSC